MTSYNLQSMSITRKFSYGTWPLSPLLELMQIQNSPKVMSSQSLMVVPWPLWALFIGDPTSSFYAFFHSFVLSSLLLPPLFDASHLMAVAYCQRTLALVLFAISHSYLAER